MPADPQRELKDRDEELLRAARSAPEGDLRAFEQLVRLYQKQILADCRYLTHDLTNSEDLAQEVFVKAFFGLPTFEGRSSFRHWLQRIKVNHCLNYIKKHEGKIDQTIDEDNIQRLEQLHVLPTADQELETLESRKRIEDVLNEMPDTLRVPLIMCDMDELSYEEISSSLGVGLSAIKMRIKRAREYFRRVYQGESKLAGGLSTR